ncbi:hypothetical protein LOTGIDRAFT_235844 [Lottia gigantea]|uniref:Uncharacterized protein n=1 Tax=Lottia gigantea TaxID=225164 RepID=V3Z3F6_LOTGI|nr:hypothetical protein LOTGIDRAFT_235844 [Lottia gigantea]ESO85158.1 hypothetical protein LOTGIDRAFT_235844 [Lottia gigantea]
MSLLSPRSEATQYPETSAGCQQCQICGDRLRGTRGRRICSGKIFQWRFNFFNIFPALFTKKSRDAISESKQQNVGGNFKGDGMQTGGTYVLEKGGNVLLEYKQDNPADHVDPNEVLKALGISGRVEVDPIPKAEDSGSKGAAAPVCENDVCQMPKKS